MRVRLALSREAMDMVTKVLGPQWPIWAAVPVLSVFLLGFAHIVVSNQGYSRISEACLQMEQAARSLTVPILLLSALRLCSLWPPSGHALPWLGLVWAPHTSVGLAFVPWLSKFDSSRLSSKTNKTRLAALLFGVFFVVYGSYTLYICQTTILHGDEGQYLLVTQSLLRDGDADLANNLEPEDILEYHLVVAEIDRAMAVPAGRVHSIHPIGLSVLLAPAYEAGLRLWANPRLAAALVMAMMAALVVSLLFQWLIHMGFGAGVSLMTTGLIATSTPLASFSTQIYPEVPALLITLLVLNRVAPSILCGRPRSGGAGAKSPKEFGGLGMLLGTLPFFHPRYAPLACLLGVALLLQAWQAPRRILSVGSIATATILAVVAIVSHNLALSGDWLGYFRPGNAWSDDALDPSTWWVSIPGHWFHDRMGLVISAPFFFAVGVPGVARFVRAQDRRLFSVGALYVCTAAVNGLHPEWTFGYCLPARFLLTALPAVALCVAAGLAQARRSVLLALVVGGAIAIGWDTMTTALALPESAYLGYHLISTSLSGYYPFAIHGSDATEGFFSAAEVLWWIGAAMALLLLSETRSWRCSLTAASAIIVASAFVFWLGTDHMAGRLHQYIPPNVADLTEGNRVITPSFRRETQPDYLHSSVQEGSDIYLVRNGRPRVVASHNLGLQHPGIYRVRIPVATEARQVAHLTHRRSAPAAQQWERRLARVASPGGDAIIFDFLLEEMRFGYLLLTHSGSEAMRFGRPSVEFQPMSLRFLREQVEVFLFEPGQISTRAKGFFEAGRYVAHFYTTGSGLSTLTQRRPLPLKAAVVVAADGRTVTEDDIRSWYGDRELGHVLSEPQLLLPQSEVLAAPWSALASLYGGPTCEVAFEVRERAEVWFLFDYRGTARLFLEKTVVFSETLIRNL
ncbi:MAG: hypothetical protein VCF24_27715 [Candidatus Latescibacterota bacterium]